MEMRGVVVAGLLAALLAGCREPPASPRAERMESAMVEVEPEAVRIEETRLAAAEAAVRAELERHAFPGAVLAVGVGARVELVRGMGHVGWREAAAPVSPAETLYDLASVTKAVATTVAVLLLVEDGRIRLDEPVQPHLPQFEGRWKDQVTWRHLLTHTAGLPGGANIRGSGERERVHRLLRTRLDVPPGRKVEYTDLGFLVAWEAAERVAGEPLDRFLERRVWRPLGMRRTQFSPGQECEACAPTLRLSTGVPYRGRPADLLARRIGGVTGNSGLFSTAHDMARFAAMIANGGELDGVRILSPASASLMLTQQPGAGHRALGWVAFCPDEFPDPQDYDQQRPCAQPIAYGHTGWTGTSLYLDPASGVWAVLLTNRSYDVRAPERMQELRREVFRRLTDASDANRPLTSASLR
jgi:CubicO group peptidase (beta-lactamase class C family)